MNITPMRLSLLEFLSTRPGYSITSLADQIAPRRHGWTSQGAARWGGGYVKPMESAGLVRVNRMVSGGVGEVSITVKGRELLAELQAAAKAASDAQALASAIESGD